MKDKQDKEKPIIDEKIYQQLMLRKKINQKQIAKMKQMTYHQLINKNRKKEPIQPPSPTKDFFYKQAQNQFRQAGFEYNVQEITKRHLQIFQNDMNKKAQLRRQMKQAPVFSQIKRGKLGIDGLFILFAIFGGITLPYIFYEKFKKQKENIVKSRKYSPQIIKNLDQDSLINIDEVSDQSIHYDNPERRKKFEQFMQKAEKMSALKKQLDL